MTRPAKLDFRQRQSLGSGSLQIVEEAEFARWAIELDGVKRAFRSNRVRAQKHAQAIYDALAPDGTCPICLRPIAVNVHGLLPPHPQPSLHAEEKRPCPGAGLKPRGDEHG